MSDLLVCPFKDVCSSKKCEHKIPHKETGGCRTEPCDGHNNEEVCCMFVSASGIDVKGILSKAFPGSRVI